MSKLARQETPETGHTFRITVGPGRGSYAVVGTPGHHDSPEFDGRPVELEVRAWSLSAALHKAAELPFPTLMGETCWCGGQVGEREPGDPHGLGCLEDIHHDWRSAERGPHP